jgi:hypothetical protein
MFCATSVAISHISDRIARRCRLSDHIAEVRVVKLHTPLPGLRKVVRSEIIARSFSASAA